MAGYYRRFMKDFSIIAKPLTQLSRKNVKFMQTQKCEQALTPHESHPLAGERCRVG
jgi:hypothetical protein